MKFPICSSLALKAKNTVFSTISKEICLEAIGDQLQIVAPVSYLFLAFPGFLGKNHHFPRVIFFQRWWEGWEPHRGAGFHNSEVKMRNGPEWKKRGVTPWQMLGERFPHLFFYLWNIHIPGTQMGPLVLIGKDPVLEGSTNKIEDKQVPGTCKYIIPTPLTPNFKGGPAKM